MTIKPRQAIKHLQKGYKQEITRTYCTWFEATRESVYCEAPTEDDSALVPRILSFMLHQPWNLFCLHVLSFFFSLKRKETVLYRNIKWTTFIWLHWNSLHKERFMSQARRTRHFAQSAKRAWSARRRGRKKMTRSRHLARKAPVMQANTG